jgi:hypothetical protein
MKLPRGDDAVVPLRKVTEYLLSESHPVGSSKAGFFRRLGFHDDNVRLLENGLLAIARDEDAIEVTSSPHGIKYVVDGRIEAPRGGMVVVRTVWIIEAEEGRPRFVTAYPK